MRQGWSDLVLAVVSLGEFEDAVAEATHVSEGRVTSIGQLIHTKHIAVSSILKRRLKDLEDLKEERQNAVMSGHSTVEWIEAILELVLRCFVRARASVALDQTWRV